MITAKYAGWLWTLSLFPMWAILLSLPFSVLIYFIIAFAGLQVAHQISPVLLAWDSPKFRVNMLRKWGKYILLPAIVFISAIAAPFAWTAGLYFAWNVYHYGMQHFGVLSMCRSLNRWRTEVAITTLLVTVAIFCLPMVIRGNPIVSLGLAVSFNHWVVDIGLSRRVARRPWIFLGTILVLGLPAFIIWQPTAHGVHPRAQWLVQIGFACGFVHFLYSRWVWKMSDPDVRDALGFA